MVSIRVLVPGNGFVDCHYFAEMREQAARDLCSETPRLLDEVETTHDPGKSTYILGPVQ